MNTDHLLASAIAYIYSQLVPTQVSVNNSYARYEGSHSLLDFARSPVRRAQTELSASEYADIQISE